MQKITPFLWYDGQAEEAATLYVSLFEDAAILEVQRGRGSGQGLAGMATSVTFRLAGQTYIAFNGGPHFTFSPAISLFISCDTQNEIDDLWDKLSAGGKPQRCGWVQDRFGVSWQVVPRALGTMLKDEDTARAKRVFDAMMSMGKIEIADLETAYAG